jgi:hypothetical protein
MSGEEDTHGIGVKLPAIVSLQSKNRQLKLNMNIGEK